MFPQVGPGVRAHITLCTSEGVGAVVAGYDNLDLSRREQAVLAREGGAVSIYSCL